MLYVWGPGLHIHYLFFRPRWGGGMEVGEGGVGKEEGEGVGKGGTFKGGPHQLFSPAILNKFSDVE